MRQILYKRLKRISSRLKREYKARKVILYGSYARGDETCDSDIDLFIVAPTRQRLIDRMANVRGLIRDLKKGLPVQPIVCTPKELEKRIKMKDPFIAEIIEEGTYL